MQLLVIASVLGLAVSAPAGGYSSGGIVHGGTGVVGGFGHNSHGVIIGGGGGGGGRGGYGAACGNGEIRHVDGSCVRPEVSRNVYLYAAPNLPVSYGPTPYIPAPKIRYNVVFVRTPEGPAGLEPIVIPPPQEKTLVYVLTKNGQVGQQVIEVPAGPGQAPEVFYVNYDEGDNPTLPGGLTLQDALSSAVSQNGQLIGGGGVGGGFIGGGGVGSGIIGGGGVSGGFIGGGGIGGGLISGGGIGGGVIGGDGIGGGVIGGGGSGISGGYSAPTH